MTAIMQLQHDIKVNYLKIGNISLCNFTHFHFKGFQNGLLHGLYNRKNKVLIHPFFSILQSISGLQNVLVRIARLFKFKYACFNFGKTHHDFLLLLIKTKQNCAVFML